MVKRIIICFYLFLCLVSFSENLYDPIQLKIFLNGSKENELGYNTIDFIPGAGNPRPLDYAISKNGIIYIYDWANNRIVQYDLNLDYIKTIKSKKVFFGYMYGIKIDEDMNFYIKDGYGIYKYDEDCNQLGFFSDEILSTTAIASKNYYPHNGYLFYYNDDFTLSVLDKDGKKLLKENTKELLKEVNAKKRSIANADDLYTYDLIDSYSKEAKTLFFKGKRLYINNRSEYLKYIKFAQDKVKKDKKHSIDDKKNITSKFYIMVELLGYDDSDNAYWQSNNSVLIISPIGEIVENVEYDGEKYFNPKIAPNGDIYFWNVKPEGVTFYKITRQW